MDCLAKCGRILIVVLNILFLLIGLVIFGLGMLLKFGFDKVRPYLDDMLVTVKDGIKELSSSSSNLGNAQLPTGVDMSKVDELVKIIEDILKDIAIILIVIGVVMLVIVLLGLCGACYKIKIFLYVYSAIIFAILVAMVTVTGLYLNKREIIDNKVKPILKNTLKDSYSGLTGVDFVSLAWNFGMQQHFVLSKLFDIIGLGLDVTVLTILTLWKVPLQFSCCGVDNFHDFNNCSQWKKKPFVVSLGTGAEFKAPLACCKSIPTGQSLTDIVCVTTPDASNSNFQTGCYEVIWSYVEKYNKYVMTIVIIVSLIQALIIFLGCWIACNEGKNSKVGHMDG